MFRVGALGNGSGPPVVLTSGARLSMLRAMALDLTLVGKSSEPVSFTYAWKDTVLYALGVGARKDELDYLYEGHGPKVLPSFAVVPMFDPMFERVAKTGGDLSMVVHGGQSVKLHKPFAASGTVSTVATVRAMYDMRRFANVLIDTVTRCEKGELLAETTASIIFRGEGNWGGDPPPKEPKVAEVPKDREPDFVIEEKTSPEQALLYRLSGDINPLHADPVFAEKVGFTQGPILHGLCTYGHMVRHVVKGACGGKGENVLAFDAQFRKPVWPGDTIVTAGYRVDKGLFALKVTVKERDESVLTNAWARVAE